MRKEIRYHLVKIYFSYSHRRSFPLTKIDYPFDCIAIWIFSKIDLFYFDFMKVIRLYLMHIMFEIISFLVYIYNGYGHKIAIILNTLYLFCSHLFCILERGKRPETQFKRWDSWDVKPFHDMMLQNCDFNRNHCCDTIL